MIIFAEDKKYALKVLPAIKSWKSVNIEKFNTSDNSFIHKIFKKKLLYFTETDFIPDWQYLFITKHSDQSQFDLLYNLSKNNPKLPDGILCLADSGSKFHGYRSREWNAHSGNLHLSIFKKPNKPVLNFNVGFTILAAVSVIQTLDKIPGMKNKAGIKWVNDILIDNAKISGVITQTISQQDIVTAVVFGIGLNIEKAPTIESNTFVHKSTCLYDHIKKDDIGISEIFRTLIDNLSKNYKMLLDGDYQILLNFYKKRSLILNREVAIYTDPIEGEDSLIIKGKVNKIGNDLELYIDGNDNPVRQGRIVLLD